MNRNKETFEDLGETEAFDNMMDDDLDNPVEIKPNNDMQNLKNAKYHMPDTHKEKQLRACIGCKLVMSEMQWHSKTCPNCMDPDTSKTSSFSGLVSVFLPSSSWVARWNNLENMHPGIYAINILEDSPQEMENQYYEQQK
jgi:RNA polymerase subunit RPABC4/transcription elongation factor Spt4